MGTSKVISRSERESEWHEMREFKELLTHITGLANHCKNPRRTEVVSKSTGVTAFEMIF
jgi:hypothetical protein